MPKTKPLENAINKLFKKREEIRDLNRKVDVLKKDKAELELVLLRMMQEQLGEKAKASSSLATATVKKEIVGNATNWDDVSKFIYRHKALYLLERRISHKSYRELILLPKYRRFGVKGIDSFEKVSVNLLTLKG